MRAVSILLGIAVIAFLLWPNMIPVGFSGVWWARHPAQPPTQPQPSATIPDAINTTPEPPALPARHALTDPAAQTPAAAIPEAEKPGLAAPNAEPKLYRRVKVRDGSTLEADGSVIRLAGIAAREAQSTCVDGSSKRWPCGGAAKAALARLIRARAVRCIPVERGARNVFSGENSIIARCSVGGTDLSAWMVRQGWAEPTDANEALLVRAAQTAKKERLGIWRSQN